MDACSAHFISIFRRFQPPGTGICIAGFRSYFIGSSFHRAPRCTLAASSFAALEPSEIVIIASRGNRESEQLAKYYARVRGVPEKICAL